MKITFNARVISEQAPPSLKYGQTYSVTSVDFKTFQIDISGTGPMTLNLSYDGFCKFFKPDLEIPVYFLSNTCKDHIYREVWRDHVKEDAENYISGDYEYHNETLFNKYKSLNADQQESICEIIAHRYVFEGDYDCNLDYWTQLAQLTDEELTNY